MVILADEFGNEIRELQFEKFDVDLNDKKDFEITITAKDWKEDLAYGSRIFIPNTEFGGIISRINSNSKENKVRIGGKTWRGILDSHIVEPPTGSDYKIVNGLLYDIFYSLIISEAGLGKLFKIKVTSDYEITSFKIDRYISLLHTLEKVAKSKGLKLNIQYVEYEEGGGAVEISYTPIIDYSQNIEFSQDSKLQFIIDENRGGVNHLICLGKGELKDRKILHLYADEFGDIGKEQKLKGLEEVTTTYEETSVDSLAELEKKGIEKFKELLNSKKMTVGLDATTQNVNIGDIVGGRDYLTGISLARPIANIIYTEKNGEKNKEYKLEEK